MFGLHSKETIFNAGVEEDIVSSSGEDQQVLVFEAGQESQQITFTIRDDILKEMDESFLLVVMAKDCCVQMDGAVVARITIQDNDWSKSMYIIVSMSKTLYKHNIPAASKLLFLLCISASDIATITFDKSRCAFQENEGTVDVGVNIQPQQPLECTVMYRVISSSACKCHIQYNVINTVHQKVWEEMLLVTSLFGQ